MIRKNFLLLIILITLSLSTIADDHTFVMVTSVETETTSLSSKELRRLYLGLTVTKNDNHIIPIRNHSDDTLHEVFLQKIMFMSSRTYERQLNLRTIKRGLKPPMKFESQQAIVETLINNKNSVAYMWEDQASRNPQLQIIKTR